MRTWQSCRRHLAPSSTRAVRCRDRVEIARAEKGPRVAPARRRLLLFPRASRARFRTPQYCEFLASRRRSRRGGFPALGGRSEVGYPYGRDSAFRREVAAPSVRVVTGAKEMTMRSDFGMLVARTIVGGAMAAHGAQKAFGWFEGSGPQKTAGFMKMLGFEDAE